MKTKEMKNSMKLMVFQTTQTTKMHKLAGFNGSVLLKVMSSFATLMKNLSGILLTCKDYMKSFPKKSSRALLE